MPTINEDTVIINKIGKDAGLEMWYDLSDEERQKEYKNDNENKYYIGDIVNSNDKFPPTIVFKAAGHRGYGKDCSIYTINLKTGKPTKKSSIQICPNKEFISQLYIQ